MEIWCDSFYGAIKLRRIDRGPNASRCQCGVRDKDPTRTEIDSVWWWQHHSKRYFSMAFMDVIYVCVRDWEDGRMAGAGPAHYTAVMCAWPNGRLTFENVRPSVCWCHNASSHSRNVIFWRVVCVCVCALNLLTRLPCHCLSLLHHLIHKT